MQKYHLTIDEHYGLAAIGLCRAGITYNGDKSSFSTYAYKCMFTAVMSELRKKNQAKTIPKHLIFYYQAEMENNEGDTALFLNYIPSKENIEGDVLSEIMFDEYSKKLNDRDKLIFSLFREGYKQREICKVVGCSQPQISRIKKKFVQYLAS